MEKAKYLILLLILPAGRLFAQQIKPDSSDTNRKIRYVETISRPSSGPWHIRRNQENILLKQRQKVATENIGFVENDSSDVEKAVKSVFNKKGIEELTTAKVILFDCYILPNGKVEEVSFYFNGPPPFSDKELSALENQLKKDITFTVTSSNRCMINFFIWTKPINFKLYKLK